MTSRSPRPWDDGRPLVLIVDADETATTLYGRWVFAQGFQLMCAMCTEGLAMALRREQPKIVISELHARDLSLADLLRRLRSDERTRHTPVIVLTHACDDPALQTTACADVVTVLPKYGSFDDLRRWMEALAPGVVPRTLLSG